MRIIVASASTMQKWCFIYILKYYKSTIMAKVKEKIVKTYTEIESGVVNGYKRVETGVVEGYQAIEDGVVGAYKKIESSAVNFGNSLVEEYDKLRKK